MDQVPSVKYQQLIMTHLCQVELFQPG